METAELQGALQGKAKQRRTIKLQKCGKPKTRKNQELKYQHTLEPQMQHNQRASNDDLTEILMTGENMQIPETNNPVLSGSIDLYGSWSEYQAETYNPFNQ